MGEQNTLRLCGATNSNFPNFSIHLLLYNDTYINLPWKPRVLLELPANPGNLKNSAHDSSASNGLALRQMERYGGEGPSMSILKLQFNKAKRITHINPWFQFQGFACVGETHLKLEGFLLKLGFQVDSVDSGFVFSAGEANQIKHRLQVMPKTKHHKFHLRSDFSGPDARRFHSFAKRVSSWTLFGQNHWNWIILQPVKGHAYFPSQ